MNAIEIDSTGSELAFQAFERDEFPFAFLAAFGNKETTLKRLRAGSNNASDVPGAVLLRNNMHLYVCEPGKVGVSLKAFAHQPSDRQGQVHSRYRLWFC